MTDKQMRSLTLAIRFLGMCMVNCVVFWKFGHSSQAQELVSLTEKGAAGKGEYED